MRLKTMLLASCATLSLMVAAEAKTLVIVLPTDYAGSKPELVREVGKTILSLRDANDRLLVYLADGPVQLASIAQPDDPKAKNPAWLKRKLGELAAPVIDFVDKAPAAPPAGYLPSNVHIPEAIGELGRNLVASLPEKQADILLIGSWLFFDPRDSRFAVTDRFYPSDGHLLAAASETPFGLAGKELQLAGATVHLCSPAGQSSFESAAYKELVRRWWSLWITRQGGRVGTFSHDLATCFDRFRSGETSGQTVYEASRDPKVEMLRVPPPTPAVLPASFERPGEYFLRDDMPISHTPPTSTSGIAWLGIRWNTAGVDLDLWARPDGTRQWLFFGNPRTADGKFNKDFRSGTGDRQYEFIQFEQPIDLTKAEVAINFYAGELPGGPEGVLRVWFAGGVYETPFKLKATQGNRGAPPMPGSAHWTRIDLPRVLGLDKK